jgi:hypothetical protein
MAETVLEEGAETSPPASPTKSILTDPGLRGLRQSWHTDDWHSYRDGAEAYDDWTDDSYDDPYEYEQQEESYESLKTDWSQTERGSHVDFASTENVPLKEGTYFRLTL